MINTLKGYSFLPGELIDNSFTLYRIGNKELALIYTEIAHTDFRGNISRRFIQVYA
jgi:hypothetical protein